MESSKTQREIGQRISMGIPVFEPDSIPVEIDLCKGGLVHGMSVNYPVKTQAVVLKMAFVAVGNPKAEPHAVCFTDQPVSDFSLADIGPEVENSPLFPMKANFEVAHVNGDDSIEARVWQRGVGETLYSTAAAAAVAITGWVMGFTGNKVKIMLPDGEATVEWDGKGEVFVTGQTPSASPENQIAPVVTSKSRTRMIEKHIESAIIEPVRYNQTFEFQEPRSQASQVVRHSQSSFISGGWRLPESSILDYTPEIEYAEADNQKRARKIEEALLSYGVEARVVQINAGPTVTQFGVEPGWDRRFKDVKKKDKDGRNVGGPVEISRTRVKVDRISSLANDLALALAAPSIRIEAPIPGKSMVGIEVPNTSVGIVSLRKVIESNQFQKLQVKGSIALALGKGAGGEAVVGELAKMPHLLIAGATGSGKTVCLNALICCILMNYSPDEIKFVMIDPKRVELTPYNSLPHLAVPVIVETDKALGALRWLNCEMDRRYQKLVSVGARNIESFNKKSGVEKLPYIVLVIDELADLMMAGFDEVERIICRLAQMARAVGIHLVVATQRPSVDVITGLIKANFPTRISFAVTSQVDSRTILDSVGAEKLLGRGDMLYLPVEAAKSKRLQGCFVSDTELEKLVHFWNSQQPQVPAPMFKIEEIAPPDAGGLAGKFQQDSLFNDAVKLASEVGTVSASYLQRKLHIGYPRAARLADDVKEALGQDLKDGGAEVA